jgi:hypothetical protein
MNTRAIPASRVFIPAIESAAVKEEEIQEAGVPEVKVFDKADKAESKEKLKHRFEQAGKELEAAKKQLSEADDDKQRETLQVRIERLEARRDLLEDILKQKSEEQSL